MELGAKYINLQLEKRGERDSIYKIVKPI